MNNRLEELMYKSGLTAQGSWDKLDDYDKKAIEKLVELVIRESANEVKNVYKQGGGTYAEKILSHFDLK